LPVTERQIEADFDAVWKSTRDILLDEKLTLYTRDLRGLFVAYTPEKTAFRLFPTRTKVTIVLEPVDEDTTAVAVETIYQRFRVTLLTEPDWHDRPRESDIEYGQSLLDRIEKRAERVETSDPDGTTLGE